MYIPKQMKQQMSKYFYDKEVFVLSSKTDVDEEGGTIYNGNEITSTFKANVSFSNNKKIQEDYGIDYDIDISITTLPENKLKVNDLVKYEDTVYNITDVLLFDSHVLMVGKKWAQ